MKKTLKFAAAIALLITAAGASVYSQETRKKDDKTPQTTTLDAWRRALPGFEEVTSTSAANTPNAPEELEENSESAAEIQQKIIDSEKRFLQAFKQKDSAALTLLLADDFMPAGDALVENQADKTGFIERIAGDKTYGSYDLEKINVRVYGATAVSTVYYLKNPESPGGRDGLVTTNVWVKRGDLWQVVSHHTSFLPKS